MSIPNYTLEIVHDCIELTCDECGHVNHWASGIEIDEVFANVDDHNESEHVDLNTNLL